MKLDDETMYKVVEVGVTLLVARAVGAAISKAWSRRSGDGPPTDPRRDDVAWVSAVGWAAGLGAAIGIARLLARVTVEKGWEKRAAKRAAPAAASV